MQKNLARGGPDGGIVPPPHPVLGSPKGLSRLVSQYISFLFGLLELDFIMSNKLFLVCSRVNGSTQITMKDKIKKKNDNLAEFPARGGIPHPQQFFMEKS